jgi:hypothetical protein
VDTSLDRGVDTSLGVDTFARFGHLDSLWTLESHWKRYGITSESLDFTARLVGSRGSTAIILGRYVDDCIPWYKDGNVVMVSVNTSRNADMKVRYGRAVGMILYVQRQTHPEISFTVRELCKFTSNPGPKIWTALERALRFLKGHKSLCIKCTKPTVASSPVELSAYCDSDSGNDEETRRSVTGYVTFTGGGPISWRCEGQGKTALSTAEAEYIAAAEASREIKHMVNVLEDLEESQGPVPLFEDNESCISWAQGRGKLEKRKHIDIKYLFIQDCVEDQLIEMKSIASSDQVADILTKGLAKEQFNHLLGKLLCRL